MSAIYVDGTAVQEIASGQKAIVVLDSTPFYAESGGQVGDRGELIAAGGTFEVADTQKIQAEVFGHHGTLRTGTLKVGDRLEARVDTALRARTMRNHSVTHLMHKALREVLGPHVQQKGSLVDADKTRFDFAQDKPMTDEEIRKVELLVNDQIMQNVATKAQVMPIEEAKKSGAMSLFGEKYGDEVRVLDIGNSRELCGGTHVSRTGDIGVFKIYSEGGVAAGIRRVEATTGDNALAMDEQSVAGAAGSGQAPESAARRRNGGNGGQQSPGREEGAGKGTRPLQIQTREFARRRSGRAGDRTERSQGAGSEAGWRGRENTA